MRIICFVVSDMAFGLRLDQFYEIFANLSGSPAPLYNILAPLRLSELPSLGRRLQGGW